MSINEDAVKHISHLARIGITEKEILRFQRELDEIVGYIDKLKTLDVGNVGPMTHVLPLKNIYREDKAKESLPIEKALKNAPQKRKDLFSVPRIIE